MDCDLPTTRHNRPKVIAKATKTTIDYENP